MFEWRKDENPLGLVIDLEYKDDAGVVRPVESIEWLFEGKPLNAVIENNNDSHVEIPVPDWTTLVDGDTATITANADARFGSGTKPIILTDTIVFVITPEATVGTMAIKPVV